MRLRPLIRASLAFSVALIAALALVAAPAQAIITHSLISTFGAGLNFPLGIAVDNSSTGSPGEVFVADALHGRVAKFKADGTADGQIDSSNITGANCVGANTFAFTDFVATDPKNGDLYVTDDAHASVTAFDSSGACLFQINPSNTMPAGAQIAGVAVDPTSGPDGADGTIYVTNGNGSKIEEFNASTHAHTGSFPVASTNGLRSLALDSSGHLYVTDWRPAMFNGNPSHGQIIEYDPAADGALIGTGDTANAQAVAVNHQDGHLFTEQNGPDTLDIPGCDVCIEEHSGYSQLADFRSSADSVPALTFGKNDLPVGPGNNGSYGVAVNDSTNTVYITDPGTGVIHAYGPSITIPDVTTGSATSPDHASAILQGHVDPDTDDAGTAITACYFQYGTDITYSGPGSGTVPCNPDPASNSPASNFSGPSNVAADLANLGTLTTYHYRLVATSTNSVPTYGADRTVTPLPNLPMIGATSASAAGQSTATVDTQINPGFGPTVFRVEYGTDSSYGSNIPFGDSIGSDGVDHAVSAQLADLSPATTYHYRVRALNYSGVVIGPDQTFNTTDVPAVSDTTSSAVTATTVALAAQVNPNFSPTTYHFDYGVGTGYGSSTPESATIGSDHFVHSAAVGLSGLVSSTTYHYRVVATNADGVTNGPDQTFPTAAGSTGLPPPPITCKHGFVKRHGKCVKRQSYRHHHKRGHSHG